MAAAKYNFQYCQKIILFSNNWHDIFLAKRTDEADYDGVYSFIGGKLEANDGSLEAGLRREIIEEIGSEAHLTLYLDVTRNTLFHKSDGTPMVLPHYIAHYLGGAISLNASEYSAYKWVPIAELDTFEPKIANQPEYVQWATKLLPLCDGMSTLTL